MAQSYNEVGLIEPTDNITVTFDFLDREDVSVTVDGVAVASNKWSWVSDGQLLALTGFPAGTATRVLRTTPAEDLQGLLVGTAVFDYPTMNLNFTQLLYVLQEKADGEAERQAVIDGLESDISAVSVALAAAEAAQTAAELAETNSETAETAAELAETNAEIAYAATLAALAAADLPSLSGVSDGKILQVSGEAWVVSASAIGTAAFADTGDYATAAQGDTADAALPKAGGTMTGTLAMADQQIERPAIKDYSEIGAAEGSMGSGTTTFSFSDGNFQSGTVTDTCTIALSNPPVSGRLGSMTLAITNGGSQTVTWHSSIEWVDDTPPEMLASGIDWVEVWTNNGGTDYFGAHVGSYTP